MPSTTPLHSRRLIPKVVLAQALARGVLAVSVMSQLLRQLRAERVIARAVHDRWVAERVQRASALLVVRRAVQRAALRREWTEVVKRAAAFAEEQRVRAWRRVAASRGVAAWRGVAWCGVA
jgi:hypothetical protein